MNLSSFSIGKYDVTIAQYVQFLNAGGHDSNYRPGMYNAAFCGIVSNSPGNYSVSPGRENYPVVDVSWNDCMDFCLWLSQVTGRTWRLPTEAEFEYAAVGNAGHVVWPWGNTFLTNYSNAGYDFAGGNVDGYADSSPVDNYVIGQSMFGIQDMAGNVWQWCYDWKDDGFYSVSPTDDPMGPATGTVKCVRGGSYANALNALRCACRGGGLVPTQLAISVGFRVVRTE